MKCPYCAENIQQGARSCRYCGRDLTLVLDLMQENARLRERISTLESANTEASASSSQDSGLKSEAQDKRSPSSGPQESSSWSFSWARLLAVVLPAIVIALSISSYTAPYTRLTNGPASLVLLIVPFLFGFWLGRKEPGRPTDAYALLGLLQGLLSGILYGLFRIVLVPGPAFGINVGAFAGTVLILCIPITLMFVSGARFGNVSGKIPFLRLPETTTRQQEIVGKFGQFAGPAALAIIAVFVTLSWL